MATRDTGQGASGLSRRDFLKASAAATAVVGCGLEFAYDPAKASAYEGDPTNYKITPTTCPYCSASCGQRVVVALTGANAGKIIDMYGDFESPMNSGGLCAKGAGTLQLVTNPRRIGAWPGAHPVKNMDGVADNIFAYDAAYTDGVAYKRTGNGNWGKMSLDAAMAEIAPKLKDARGLVAPAGTLYPLFSAGDTIGATTYTGFSGLNTVKKADGSYFVATNGTKVNEAALLTLLAGATTPAGTAALLAAFDSLVYTATDPVDRTTYTLAGMSDIGTVLLTNGVFANTGDVVRDGATYYTYAVDANTGDMHVATSANMLAWTYVGSLGKPAGTANLTSPSVLKSGADLKVWFTDTVAQKLRYASYTAGVWSAATNVTVGGADPVWFVGHPMVSADATTFTLQYVLGGGGIRKATAPVATPAVFAASTAVYDNVANAEGNVSSGGSKGILFTTYALPDPNDTGWAFSNVLAVITAASASNSYGVAFFGSSHMNNESNYMYRKLIADFGTSNVEHQARI